MLVEHTLTYVSGASTELLCCFNHSTTDRGHWHGGRAPDQYSGGTRFESRPRHRLPWGFREYPHCRQVNEGIVESTSVRPRRFLMNPFQLITHQSFYNSMLYSLDPRIVFFCIYYNIQVWVLNLVFHLRRYTESENKVLRRAFGAKREKERASSRRRVSSSGMWRRVVCWVACHLLTCWFLLQLFIRPWRWRRYVPPKRRLQLNRLHGVTSQKMILFLDLCFPIRRHIVVLIERRDNTIFNL
jgi:hypothetical protein